MARRFARLCRGVWRRGFPPADDSGVDYIGSGGRVVLVCECFEVMGQSEMVLVSSLLQLHFGDPVHPVR